MSRVVILGAGDVGGAVARHLAAADVASDLTLVDEAGDVAAGKALDIAQAGVVDRSAARLAGTADVSVVVGAAAIVVADRAAPRPVEWSGEEGLALVRRVVGWNQAAPVLFAGHSQANLIERGVIELGIARSRLIGTAPEALRAAATMATALEAGVAPLDVSLLVVGRAPDAIIVPWDDVAISGRPATRVLSSAAVARLDARVARLWPPGPLALGAAAAAVLHTAFSGTRRVHAVTIALDRGEGTPGRAAMLQAIPTRSGVARPIVPALSTRDRVRLETVLQR